MKIQKAYFHVDVNGSESDGLTLQCRLPDLCRDWLLPAFERILNCYAPPEGTLCIERLEIDAGTMALDCLEHDLTESVAQALEKALREQIPADEPADAGHRPANVRHKTRQHSVNEALVVFLETGQLPWSFCLPEDRSLEQVVLDAWQETEQSGGSQGAEQVRQVLASASARKRLTRQFMPKLLTMLLTRLAPAGARAMEAMLQILDSGKVPPAEGRQIERLIWESAFARAATGQPMTAETIVRDLLPAVAAEQATAAEVLARHWLPDTKKQSSLLATEIEGRREGAEPAVAAQEQLGKSFHADNAQMLQNQIDAFRYERSAEAASPSPANSSSHFAAQHTSPDLLTEGIYISNAGLVLLNPFLPQFFGALGIAADKQLLQSERALCLLHFLATGQRIAPEYELMLPKVLCNIPLDMPVEADAALTDKELDEANALLKAVISHWQALRNTSPDGLRGTFFVRPGKISRRDDDWLLQVEPQTWDILLDQLPWGIGMIKLPWMERMLWVDWA